MPKEYTVVNNETGQEVTFAWHLDAEPTDSDMEEVFAAAKPPEKPSIAERIGGMFKPEPAETTRVDVGAPQERPSRSPQKIFETEEQELFGGGRAGEISGATGSFAPDVSAHAPSRALPEEKRLPVEPTPPLEVEHKARKPIPNVPLVATVYGAAKSLPFAAHLLPEGEDIEAIETTHPGSVTLGYVGGMAGQTVAVGGTLAALPAVQKLQTAATLVKNPVVRKAAQMGLQAAIRGVAGGATSGAQNAQQVADGKQTVAQGLLNTAETTLANVVSVLPEGMLPRNAVQLVAQPAADALFNYLFDKGIGRTYSEEDVVEIGGTKVPKRYLWESLAALGFATMDVETGQIKPKPDAVDVGQDYLDKLSPKEAWKGGEPTEAGEQRISRAMERMGAKEAQAREDVLRASETLEDAKAKIPDITKSEFERFKDPTKSSVLGEDVPQPVLEDVIAKLPGAEKGMPATVSRRPQPTEEQLSKLAGGEPTKATEETKIPEYYKPGEEPAVEAPTFGEGQRKPLVREPRSNTIDNEATFKTGQREAILENESGSVRVPRGAGKTRNATEKFWKEWFASNGMLPDKVAWSRVLRDGQINNYMRDIDRTVAGFDRAVKKTFGKSKLSDEQAFQIDAALKGETDVATLPEPLQPVIKNMRTQIDAISQRMIDEGLAEGELAGVISDNLGYYATRSFRVHDDPKWAQKVPDDVRNNAKAFLRNEITQRYTTAAENIETRLDGLAAKKADAQAEGLVPGVDNSGRIAEIDSRIEELSATLEDVRKQASPSEEQINGQIDNLLYRDGAPVSVLASGSKLGSKNLAMLKRRKDIPPQIRALWGEYKNADVNYAKSVSKMSQTLANHKFLTDALAIGQDKFFFDEPLVRDGESYSAKIATDQSSAMAPLNGKYTTPEIKKAFEEATTRETLPDFLRLYMKAIGTVKYAKTVGSHMTHVRNTTGNVSFAIANGHFRIGNMPDAFKATFGDIVGKSPESLQAEIKELIGFGVLSDGARAGELRGIIDDATQGNIDVLVGKGYKRKLQKVGKFITKAYGAEDDVWKFYAFRNEYARYKEALPDMPEGELKQRVARIVRNTYPTYSMVPKAMQKLRRFPLVGTFVSFPAEVIRTAKNTFGLMTEELADPRLRKIGAQRLTGMLTAVSVPTAIAIGSRLLTGTTEKKEEAMREFMPPWSKNSPVVHVGQGDDLHRSYIDLGYSDPHAYLRKPLIAFMRGENWQEKVIEGLQEIYSPFLSEDILTQKFFDLKRNKTKEGQPIFNPADTPINQATDIAVHIAEAFEFGTISGLRRMYKGALGKEGRSGTPYDFKTEAFAQTTGIRTTKMDVPRSLAFKGYAFNRDVRDAMRLARKRNIPLTEQQLMVVFDRMHKTVGAAYLLGMKKRQIVKTLLDAGLPKSAAGTLVNGRYQEYVNGLIKRKEASLKTSRIKKERQSYD